MSRLATAATVLMITLGAVAGATPPSGTAAGKRTVAPADAARPQGRAPATRPQHRCEVRSPRCRHRSTEPTRVGDAVPFNDALADIIADAVYYSPSTITLAYKTQLMTDPHVDPVWDCTTGYPAASRASCIRSDVNGDGFDDFEIFGDRNPVTGASRARSPMPG